MGQVRDLPREGIRQTEPFFEDPKTHHSLTSANLSVFHDFGQRRENSTLIHHCDRQFALVKLIWTIFKR